MHIYIYMYICIEDAAFPTEQSAMYIYIHIIHYKHMHTTGGVQNKGHSNHGRDC